jgi:AcrR family transcriptional regulator
MASHALAKERGKRTNPRVVKAAADRKNEIIDCAQALFFAKGYETTTVADIIERAKISKGAFYHHFVSKEDLLDALTDRISRAVIAATRDVLEDQSLDALARLNRVFQRGGQWKVESAAALRWTFSVVLSEENGALYQRMVKAAMMSFGPVLTRIVEQGNREGIFKVPDPAIVADMLLHLASSRQALVADAIRKADAGQVEDAIESLERRLLVEQTIIDRILGLPEGSVQLFEPGYVRAMLTG